jgi:hypothetical protein
MTSLRALIVTALVLGCAATAAAQGNPKKEAKAAFDRAVEAEHKKDWRTAIAEYQTAYDLMPHPDVLHNIALNFERLEELRDAATFYRRYLDESTDPPDRGKVEKLIASLKARPGEVTITSDPSGADVEIDGKRRGATPLTVELSGAHHVAVSADSGTREEDIVVEYGEPRTVDVSIVPKTGVVVITGNVPGAQISVDGVVVGVVPMEVPLPAGPHRILVTADGWASMERPIDVPPEGSTQMTANLVRPLGFVEPEVTTLPRTYYVTFAGGADASTAVGGLYQLTFGLQRGRWAGGLGYGYVESAAGFALEARVAFTTTKIRPYARVTTFLSGNSTIFGSLGVLASYKTGPRAELSVFLDVGVGMTRDPDLSDDVNPDRALIIPVIGGVQIGY